MLSEILLVNFGFLARFSLILVNIVLDRVMVRFLWNFCLIFVDIYEIIVDLIYQRFTVVTLIIFIVGLLSDKIRPKARVMSDRDTYLI